MTPTLPLLRDMLLPLQSNVYGSIFPVPSDFHILSKIEPVAFGHISTNSDESLTVVTIRGTEGLAEWTVDVDAVAVPVEFGPPGCVHSGFQLRAEGIFQSIIDGLKDPKGDLIVQGHSLGGALAILVAAKLAWIGQPPTCITWGGPRVAWHDDNGSFKAWCDKQFSTYRVVNQWDIVPRVPTPEQGYSHLGRRLMIDGGFTFDVWEAHIVSANPNAYATGLARLSDPLIWTVSP